MSAWLKNRRAALEVAIVIFCGLQAVSANPFESFAQTLKLVGQLPQLEDANQQKQRSFLIGGAGWVEKTMIMHNGRTLELSKVEANVLKSSQSNAAAVIQLFNKIIRFMEPSMEARIQQLPDGGISVNDLGVPLLQLSYQSGEWTLAALDTLAPLMDASSDPASVVAAVNHVMPAEVKLVLRDEHEVVIEGVEGVSYEVSYSSDAGMWELRPTGGLAMLMNPDISASDAWGVYQRIMLEQGASMKTLMPFLQLKGQEVLHTDGYIFSAWFKLKYDKQADMPWELAQHDDFTVYVEAVPLIQANKFSEAIHLLEASPKGVEDYAQTWIGDFQLKQGNLAQALKIAERLIQKYPESVFAAQLMIHVDLERERYDAVLDRCQTIIAAYDAEKREGLSSFYASSACALQAQGKSSDAMKSYETAISINEDLAQMDSFEKENGHMGKKFRALMRELEETNQTQQ